MWRHLKYLKTILFERSRIPSPNKKRNWLSGFKKNELISQCSPKRSHHINQIIVYHFYLNFIDCLNFDFSQSSRADQVHSKRFELNPIFLCNFRARLITRRVFFYILTINLSCRLRLNWLRNHNSFLIIWA